MSSASSSPKNSLDRTCNNIRKAENQPCNVTDDNLGPNDCYESMHAFKKIRTSTSGLRKSPNKWTKEENQKLAALVASYGEKKWKRISAEMGGQKTGAQCAQHWKRVLSPEIRKGHWDENEEDLLLRLVVQYGSCWKKIAKKIPQRTDIQCRYQYLKAKQSREVMWDAKEDESLIKKVMEMANCNFFQILNGGASTTTTTSTSTTSTSTTTTTTTTTTTSTSASDSPTSSSPFMNMSLRTPALNSPSLMSSPSHMSSPSNSPMLSDSSSGSSPQLAPLRNLFNPSSPMASSPTVSHSVSTPSGKDDDSELSSGSGSSSEEEYNKMKMSGESSKDAWNDDKQNVNMSESAPEGGSAWRSNSGVALNESLCANCHSPFASHVNKVVWLEISEHMARLKLTSTLRTALECKSRFTELLGNKISTSAPSNFSHNNTPESVKPPGLKTSGDIGRGGFGNHPLGGSGGMGFGNTDGNKGFPNSTLSDANNIKINSTTNKPTTASSGYNGGNINLTNCNNNNITINITNSYTTNNTLQSGVNYQPQLTHCTNTPVSSMKTEPLMGPAHLLSKNPDNIKINPVASILSSAPPFPSFPHLSHPSFPNAPQPPMLKGSRHPSSAHSISSITSSHSHGVNVGVNVSLNVPSGLESLAAVASILPREMLADYF